MKRFFKRLVINMIRNKQRRAAEELASFLIRDNHDFRNASHSDLTRAIMSKKEVKLSEIGY